MCVCVYYKELAVLSACVQGSHIGHSNIRGFVICCLHSENSSIHTHTHTHTVKSCHYLHTRHLENVLGDPILPCHPHSLSLSFFLPFSSGFPFVFFTLVFTPMAFSSLSPWLSLSLSLSRPVLHPVWHTVTSPILISYVDSYIVSFTKYVMFIEDICSWMVRK